MSYAAIARVQGLIPKFVITASTTPNTTQAEQIIDDVDGEINACLDSISLAIPVTTPQDFVDRLAHLNAVGAAAAILRAVFPNATGPGESPAFAFWWSWYKDGKKALLEKVGIPPSLLSGGTSVQPATYLTRNPDENEDIGDIAEPVFTRDEVF